MLKRGLRLVKEGKNAERDRDPYNAAVVDGIYGFMAAGLEYLRWLGETPVEVQSGIAQRIQKYRGTKEAQDEMALARLNVREPSDANKKIRLVDKEKLAQLED